MPARNTLPLFLALFAALMPTDFRRVAYAVLEPDKVLSPAPKIHCDRAEDLGTGCARPADEQLPPRCSKNNRAPVASSFKASKSLVYSAADCPAGTGGACAEGGLTVELSADVEDPDGDAIVYTYTTTEGRIKGIGPKVTWDLTNLKPGTYKATVEYDDRCGCIGFSSVTVTVDECGCGTAQAGGLR